MPESTKPVAAHTPLPWTVDQRFDRIVILGDGNELIVAQLGPWIREVEAANAALIVHRVNRFEQLVEALKVVEAAIPLLDAGPNRYALKELKIVVSQALVGIERGEERKTEESAVVASTEVPHRLS